MIYLYSILGLGGLAALAWVVWAIKDWERSKYKAKEAEKERDDALRHTDRPRDTADNIMRLRKWRDKLKD